VQSLLTVEDSVDLRNGLSLSCVAQKMDKAGKVINRILVINRNFDTCDHKVNKNHNLVTVLCYKLNQDAKGVFTV